MTNDRELEIRVFRFAIDSQECTDALEDFSAATEKSAVQIAGLAAMLKQGEAEEAEQLSALEDDFYAGREP